MKLLRRDFLHLAAGVAALLAVSQPAHAQGYPSRPITMIVPYPAGGGTDVIARIVSEHMSRTLGQPIVIENIAGAGGTTGTARAARADPNGYTIEMGHMGTHASAVAFYPNLAYKPDVDFAPIGLSSLAPVMIVARRDFPAKDLQEFVSYVKANAQKLIAPSPAKVDSPAFSRAADDAHVIGIKGSKQLLNTSAGLVRLLATKIDRARSSGSLEPGSARGEPTNSVHRTRKCRHFPCHCSCGLDRCLSRRQRPYYANLWRLPRRVPGRRDIGLFWLSLTRPGEEPIAPGAVLDVTERLGK